MRYVLLTVTVALFASPAVADFRTTATTMQVQAADLRPCDSHDYPNVTRMRLLPMVHPYFTICYDPANVADLKLVRKAARNAIRIGRDKYGLRRPVHHEGGPLHTVIFLLPDGASARPGYFFNWCCYQKDGNEYVAEIHMMAPSAMPDWTGYGICYPNMREYMYSVVAHEMMHSIHRSFDWDYDYRDIVIEGLAEYDSYFYTTPWARTGGVNNLLELADGSHKDRIYLVSCPINAFT